MKENAPCRVLIPGESYRRRYSSTCLAGVPTQDLIFGDVLSYVNVFLAYEVSML